jgi:hypothetical protein
MSGNSQESILGEKWLARPRVAYFQRRSNNLRIRQGDCKNIGLNDKRQRGVKREERGGEPIRWMFQEIQGHTKGEASNRSKIYQSRQVERNNKGRWSRSQIFHPKLRGMTATHAPWRTQQKLGMEGNLWWSCLTPIDLSMCSPRVCINYVTFFIVLILWWVTCMYLNLKNELGYLFFNCAKIFLMILHILYYFVLNY